MTLNLSIERTEDRHAVAPHRRKSYKQQLTPVQAMFEAPDNVIAAGYERDRESFRVDIGLLDGGILVKDNVGGVFLSDWPKLVDSWESGFATDSPTPSMNAVGGLIAAYVFDAEYYAFTNPPDHEPYGVHVEEGVEEAEITSVPSTLVIDEGETIIYFDDPDQTLLPDEATLREQLGVRYQQWLRHDNDRPDLTLTVNEEAVEAPTRPSFTRTPFHFPRRYHFEHPNGNDASVHAEVTVGLTDDPEDGGIDLHCQGVCIDMASRSIGDIAAQLKSSFSNHPHLRIVIKFWSANSTQLPWNRDKTTIKTSHPVWEDVSDWIVRAVRSYTGLQHLQEFKDVRDPYLDAEWPTDFPIQSYDAYVIGENERFRNGENPTWLNNRKQDVKTIVQHARRQARTLSLDPAPVVSAVDLPDEVGKQAFSYWFREFVTNIINDDSVGFWNNKQSLDGTATVSDLTLFPDDTPTVDNAKNVAHKAKTDKRHGLDRCQEYDGWQATVYETVHNNTSGPDTGQQMPTDTDDAPANEPTTTEDADTETDDSDEADDGDETDDEVDNQARAENIVPRITRMIEKQHENIQDYDGTLSPKDEVLLQVFPSLSREDVRHLQLMKKVERSTSTSLGTFFEDLAAQFEAEKLPDDNDVRRRGTGFDIQTTLDHGTYVIQMKSKVNTMNTDTAESHAESLAAVEQNDDDDRKPRLGIVFGDFADIPNAIQNAIKEHDGLEQDWDEYVLVGDEFWEHVTGADCNKDDVTDVLDRVGAIIQKDDELDSDIITTATERLDAVNK